MIKGKKIKSAQTPQEIDLMIEQMAEEIVERDPPDYPDPMEPPWAVFPDYPKDSLGWRMGPGEDYGHDFSKWFRALSKADRADYVEINPEPEDWDGFYELKMSD